MNSEKKRVADTARHYPTVSYLDIRVDRAGNLPSNPYILQFENKTKRVVFCGVNHLTDPSDIENPMFAKIEEHFLAFKPDIAVNEGGDLSHYTYTSKKQALLRSGEIGLLKFLCDSVKIKTVNGDPADKLELEALLKTYSKGEVLAYIITERLMWGLKGQGIKDSLELKKQYTAFLQGYIMQEGGVALTAAEQDFNFYKAYYERLLNRPFDLETLEPTNPFDPQGKFQEIGRRSKEIRDQFLLATIDRLLETNNNVFVVFGGWHLLTCKPGLEKIVKQKRNNSR